VLALPAEAQFVGSLEYPGDIDLHGSFDGTLRCRRLTVAAGAHHVGVIVAEVADLSGEVDAEIYADSLFLRGGCAVVGEAYHASLTLEPGSIFEGKSRRHPKPRSLAPAAAGEAES
jgi:cytoskeletal protein CcmA (bactofilin family)